MPWKECSVIFRLRVLANKESASTRSAITAPQGCRLRFGRNSRYAQHAPHKFDVP
jgi:hypothetical protein